MSRKSNSIINAIAAAVKNMPGKTGAELSEYLQMPGAYRRLSEINRLGLVKKGNKRMCDVSGKPADTWYADDRPAEIDRGLSPKQEIARLKSLLEHERRVIEKLRSEIAQLQSR